MLLSKEYVGYLARQVTQKLIAGEFIETKNVPAVTAALNNALLEELQLEDRINDEVRLILGGNVLRAFREAGRVAAGLQQTTKPEVDQPARTP